MLVDSGTAPEKAEPPPGGPVIKLKKPDKPAEKEEPKEKARRTSESRRTATDERASKSPQASRADAMLRRSSASEPFEASGTLAASVAPTWLEKCVLRRSQFRTPRAKMIRSAASASPESIFETPCWRSRKMIGVSPNRAPRRFSRQRISSWNE